MIQLTSTKRIELAAALALNEQYLYQCLTDRRKLPPDRRVMAELKSGGQITVEQWGDEVSWSRIPDPDWPHPDGRPVIDVGRSAIATQPEAA